MKLNTLLGIVVMAVLLPLNVIWLNVDTLVRLGLLALPGFVIVVLHYLALLPVRRLAHLPNQRWFEYAGIAVAFGLAQSLILYAFESALGRLNLNGLILYTLACWGLAALAIWVTSQRIIPSLTARAVATMSKTLRWLPVVTLVAGVNLVGLIYFNTLNWPFLWPDPGIYLVIGLFVAAMVFPEVFSGIWALRVVGLAMVFIGQCYVLHSIDVALQTRSLIAVMHVVGITGTYIVMVLSYINQILPRDNRAAPPPPAELPHVAAVVPTYGEPLEIVEATLLSLLRLDYPADRLKIIVSDDGWRDDMRLLADRLGVHYAYGPRQDAKAGNLNSALEQIAGLYPQAELVLTQDADETIDPTFLQKVVGYFSDDRIAFVQTPKDAVAPDGDPFGVRDRVFYDVIQAGRNGSGAAFSCGSGVLWRIAAVQSIGGFSTWNVVEDLTTSYLLHAAGWRSEYHNEILSVGLAPDDIPGLLKQRGTWAVDTWRLFLFKSPLTTPGLTLRQRLQYTELGMFYVTATIFMPLLLLVPVLSLFTGEFVPIEGAALFPWVAASVLYYMVLARRGEYLKRMWQYWVGHSPTYIRAFVIALRSRGRKPAYKVTRKERMSGFYGTMLWMQFLYLFAGAGAIVYALAAAPHTDILARLTNSAILLFFMFLVGGICAAAFYGIKAPAGSLEAAQQMQPAVRRPDVVLDSQQPASGD
jgi:cellulose synthase (UDP-forming)